MSLSYKRLDRISGKWVTVSPDKPTLNNNFQIKSKALVNTLKTNKKCQPHNKQ